MASLNTATNVTAGKPNVTGAIYYAPLGTTLPTSASASLDSATFTCLGYVSEDGVTNNNSPESENVKAWGGDTVLTIQTDRPDTFAFTLIESINEDVLKAVYGSGNVNVDANGNISIEVNADAMTGAVWVIDMVLRGNRAKRIAIPNGTITELGEIVYRDNEAVGYPITLTDVADSNGNYHYEYIAGSSASI